MDEVSMEMPMGEMGYANEEVKKPEKINNINNDDIVNMLYDYTIEELTRIENYISEENNALSKTPDVLEVSDDMIQEKSVILGAKLDRNNLEINQFGRYSFEMREDCVKVGTYAFGKRLSHHFLFEDENGNETKLSIKYKKVLSDVLFYKLPDNIKKEYIRKHKLAKLV